MLPEAVVRLCWNQREACGENGHGDEMLALRVCKNGSTQIQIACENCGQGGTWQSLKKKDHPEWEQYPVLHYAPQTWEDGCRCQWCIDVHNSYDKYQVAKAQREEYRARFRPAWLLTAWRMRQDRTRRFPDWAEFLEYQRSEHWRNIRQIVRERFDGRCAACNSSDGLEVHHRTYERVGMEEIGDLTLLCTECHSLLHAEWNYVLDLPSPVI